MTTEGDRACAVCSHGKRACHPDCPFVLYFPGTNEGKESYERVNNLYCLKYIKAMMSSMKAEERNNFLASIKYEANMRARFPVGGCLGIVHELSRQINDCLEELYLVKHQLDVCGARNSSYRTGTVFKNAASRSVVRNQDRLMHGNISQEGTGPLNVRGTESIQHKIFKNQRLNTYDNNALSSRNFLNRSQLSSSGVPVHGEGIGVGRLNQAQDKNVYGYYGAPCFQTIHNQQQFFSLSGVNFPGNVGQDMQPFHLNQRPNPSVYHYGSPAPSFETIQNQPPQLSLSDMAKSFYLNQRPNVFGAASSFQTFQNQPQEHSSSGVMLHGNVIKGDQPVDLSWRLNV